MKAVTRHISYRTQRAIEFCLKEKHLCDEQKSLVVSGGVACNDFIFNSISRMAKTYNFDTYRPSKNLCSDNGVMIAWNGIEKIIEDHKCLQNNCIDEIQIIGKCSLGKSLKNEVLNANISCKWVKVK